MKSAFEVRCQLAKAREQAMPVAKTICDKFTETMYANSRSRYTFSDAQVRKIADESIIGSLLPTALIVDCCKTVLESIGFEVDTSEFGNVMFYV